ncbi:cleavage and polyadenylation specificity factor [Salix suchowensis]|nr:cleavage and polyadenylation specificity factor [Salix suchowensis]
MVDIAGVRVLYTGDYSRKKIGIFVLLRCHNSLLTYAIIESTYGVQLHQPRHLREKRFTDVIHSTLSQGGRVLIPAFALGRAQELLLILDEYWSNHPELHNIPIYYASPLEKGSATSFANSNPFKFKHISPLNSIEDFIDVGPSVVMASPSGLQSGLSRQLFDMWCSDKKNACVIPGYVVVGTLAKTIINEPKRLKQKLITEFADGNTKIITPKNCQSVEMYFNSEKMAKTIGKMAERTPDVSETVNGILVKKGFTYQIMHLKISMLEQIYESVESGTDEESGSPTLHVHELVTVKQESDRHISLQWSADPISDMVSDSVVALVLNISREVPKEENRKKAEKVIYALLVSLFGDVKLGENGKLIISVDGNSENEGLKERVRTAFRRIQSAVSPIPHPAS